VKHGYYPADWGLGQADILGLDIGES
jgi:hypothetical protein